MSATVRYHVGDALSVMRTLPDGAVDCLVTSPPYPWQRAYLADDDPAKVHELGQEDTPGEALEALLEVMDEVWRVLSDDATFWVNLGDVHAGSGGSGGDYDEGGMKEGQARYQGTARIARNSLVNGTRSHSPWRGLRPGWPRDQSACFIPHLFGASLAYGRNLLTGQEHQQWVVRPPVTWCKPSPSTGRLDRRFRTATELFLYGGKHQGHFFDLDAVREPSTYHRDNESSRRGGGPGVKKNGALDMVNPQGAPPFNWWVVNSDRYAGSHYATFSPELITRPIKAGCPKRVCMVCGKASQPVHGSGVGLTTRSSRAAELDGRQKGAVVSSVVPEYSTRVRLGDSDCGHDAYRNGVVLDPFAGTGTTGLVAQGHGRDALLIDLDRRNVELARQRVGPMWFEVVEPEAVA